MSPEQALGRDVDHRSDIFSLGAILYEMSTGRLAFAGSNASETLDLILHTQPEPMTNLNPRVPAELEKVVEKCLEKSQERRYQSTGVLALDLKTVRTGCSFPDAVTGGSGRQQAGLSIEATRPLRLRNVARRRALGLASAGLLFLTAVAYGLLWRGASTGARPEIKSIAVLPLENLSGDPAQEYFADGMTESLISHLAQIRALRVISRTSVIRFKGVRKSLPEIARVLKVDAVVEGTVQRSGGRVRVTVQLIRAATDAHLWAHDYETDMTDLLRLESEVAQALADEIRIQVTTEERARLASARTVNPRAHVVAAAVYAALGDKDTAFGILEKAAEERDSLLVFLKEDPPFESLHSDPRWQFLIRRMSFPRE